MIKLSMEQVIKLHTILINETGGLDGIRDMGLLESALSSPFQMFSDLELYPTIYEKAARLCYGLINNHIFIDGNKRIGVLVMLVFLDINNISVKCNNNELIDLGFGIASGNIEYNEILEWILEHIY